MRKAVMAAVAVLLVLGSSVTAAGGAEESILEVNPPKKQKLVICTNIITLAQGVLNVQFEGADKHIGFVGTISYIPGYGSRTVGWLIGARAYLLPIAPAGFWIGCRGGSSLYSGWGGILPLSIISFLFTGEVGYKMVLGGFALEPYAGMGYIMVSSLSPPLSFAVSPLIFYGLNIGLVF